MLKKVAKLIAQFIILIFIFIATTNIIVIFSTKNSIISNETANNLENVDCILVLGAGIKGNNPSPMLEDRLLQGISLYQNNASPKILVSGDHINQNYDEVNTMKDYLVGHKVPSQDVFMDHAGISTYDSIYRAKYIFNAKNIIIVTQKYHLYRALYIAKQLDIEAHGVTSNQRIYTNQEKRDIREILARSKEFIKTIYKPTSKYLGEEISLQGNGDLTND